MAALYNHFFPTESVYEKIAGLKVTESHVVVAAIDFGSTYSGYAYSFRDEYERDVLKFHTNTWYAGTLASIKTPTSVLFNPDKTFHNFGYEAENAFTVLCADEQEKDYFFFRNFKMFLHYEKKLTRDSVIHDVNRNHRSMSAMTVFSESIKYLKETALQQIRRSRPQIHNSEVKWVVTIPAIWNDRAKQFMREASEKAGIPPESLILAIEPEVASLYCKMAMENQDYDRIGIPRDIFRKGSLYLLVDAGGGTVDCTVHEILRGGKVKELHSCIGAICGGTSVDREFTKFLEENIGKKVIEQVCHEHPDDFFDVIRNFEMAKRLPYVSLQQIISIKLPMSLFQIYEQHNKRKLEEVVNNTSLTDTFFVQRDKLLFRRDTFNNFFSSTTSEILKVIENILSYPPCKKVSYIVLVGGFADSEVLTNAIEHKFRDKQVIFPENRESGNAVMKGAVLFGHNQSIIVQRKARLSYGIRALVDFRDDEDPIENKTVIDGKEMCENFFDVLVRKGDTLKVDEPQVEREYQPVTSRHEMMKLDIYTSPDEAPRYTNKPDCIYLGQIYVPRESSGGKIILRLYFGKTEFECTIQTEKSAETNVGRFDFLAG